MSVASFPAIVLKARQIAIQILICLALLCAGVLCALAENGHSQLATMQQQTPEQKDHVGALLQIVRDFNDPLVSRAELDPSHPQIVIYEPTAKMDQGPPELMGQALVTEQKGDPEK